MVISCFDYFPNPAQTLTDIKIEMEKKTRLIGIAGGTGSGKSLLAQTLLQQIGPDKVVYIQQDSYYKDLSELPIYQPGKRNFDHPASFDFKLLNLQIRRLLESKAIEQPLYDSTNHVRTTRTRTIEPRKLVILEGILVLYDPELRELMDIKVFVDTPPDIRLIRRIKCDLNQRGKDLESIFQQYENSVRPMHLQFVEPSKQFADIIIPHGGMNAVALGLLKTHIDAILKTN